MCASLFVCFMSLLACLCFGCLCVSLVAFVFLLVCERLVEYAFPRVCVQRFALVCVFVPLFEVALLSHKSK